MTDKTPLASNKEQYKVYCEAHPEIPLFSQYWWMEAVCYKKQWDVLLIHQEGEIVASLPYLIGNKWGFRYILQPQLTQTNGVWINYPADMNANKRLHVDKLLCTEFIRQLNQLHLSYFKQCFHHSFTNWLPFYWEGFSQTTRYSYIIEDISNPDELYPQFAKNKRKQINRAQRSLHTTFDISAEQFYDALCLQREKTLYSKEFFQHVHQTVMQNNSGFIVGVEDASEQLHCAVFIVYDKTTAYFLATAINPEYRNSGATALMIWECIKKASTLGLQHFDFEGSMNKEIEHSHRGFATKQVPFFEITKAFNCVGKIVDKLL